jgi:hypothetical protein
MEAYLSAYSGDGTVTIGNSPNALTVKSNIRGVMDQNGNLTRDVLVTTTMTIAGKIAKVFDYKMSFGDTQNFNIIVGAQIAGRGICHQLSSDLDCSVAIPSIKHKERFVLSRFDNLSSNEVLSKKIRAEGTTTLNGKTALLKYELIEELKDK